MHAGQLGKVGLCNVHVERLALVNVCSPVGSHVDQRALRNLPHGLVELLQVTRNLVNILRLKKRT